MNYPRATATAETLPNGLTLILDPDPAAPVVSAQIWVETGSLHEDRHLGCGLSHFLEHMVFKGTRDFNGGELADAVQAAGGHWNAYTTFDRTVYHIDGPSPSLPVFLRVLTGLVFFPTLPETEFDNEREVIRREIDMGLDDPDNALQRLLLATTFTTDPRRLPVIGHRHLFDTLTHTDLVDYHRRRYVTDRCFAVISGDFDPAETRRVLADLTAGCLPAHGREVVPPCDPPQLGPRRTRETFPVPNSRISWAWKIPPLDHPDSPAFGALATLLGRGRSSLLHHRLREERGLALEISAFAWTCPGREGLFGISADAEVANRDLLIDAVAAEIASLTTARLDDDLAKAKRQLAVSQFGGLCSASGRAADLGSNWHEARDLDFTSSYLELIERVTVEDIRRVAANLTDQRLTLAILDPEDAPPPARITPRPRRREEITVHKLPNGITLALAPDQRVPIVRCQAAAKAGLYSEIPATNGINQLLAAALPKGTLTRSARELTLTLENLGASLSANGGNNALLVKAGGLSRDLATIADVFGEVLHAPALTDAEVAREASSQLAAIAESLQEPLPVAFKTMRRLLFGNAGYGLDALGTPESVAALTTAALRDHHDRHCTGSNLAIAIAGDFEPAAALDILTAATSKIPAGTPWSPVSSMPTPGGEAVARLPKKQAVLAIGFPGAAITGEDRFALSMLQEYASDMAGPLFTRLREELGLAYQVGATQFLGHDTGLFAFYIATSPEQADLARAELLSEIAKIAGHGIPDAAFGRVRATVLSSLALHQQSPSAIAQTVALDCLFDQPADFHRRLPEIYTALDPATVRETAARFFGVPPCIATVLPEE
jgi:zinc protease